MRHDYTLVALFGWVVPILTTTTTTTCPCWSEIIRDAHPSSTVAESGLCGNPSLLAQRFEECIARERCGSVQVKDQERWFRELCDADGDDVGLQWVEELRRRDGNDDNNNNSNGNSNSNSNSNSDNNSNNSNDNNISSDDNTPTTTEDKPPDPPTPTPKKPSVPPAVSTKSPPKPPATSAAPPTKASSASSAASTKSSDTKSSTTSTDSSSTSTTTSASTTSTSTSKSSPTAPAASATQTSSSGPAMGPASIAAATVFSAFAAACIGFLIFVCFRRIKRNRQSQKKGPMGEQLLGGAAKAGSGSQRNVSGSSRSIHDTQSMFSDHNDSAASIPLTDQHSSYSQRSYPLGSTAYHPAPQYEPRDTYNPNGDYGDLGQQPNPYSTYSYNPSPERFHSHWSPPNAHSGHDQGWNAAPIAPIRNMRGMSASSSHHNLPAALTPGEQPMAYGAPELATGGGYPRQYTPTSSSPPRSRYGS
ncbi:hypothetical protein GP486_006858 [Trichoglossum hirsutum]|uniref:Extracellular membrane protein CFEM domain-containing protein n=1 Tax=Trichoglossum hirsutum TaxID=265104 RepID=A0A9P8L763_9PEZI|nr:hypothetical protein GP486_006858 [Trichoglossum hirsutum]